MRMTGNTPPSFLSPPPKLAMDRQITFVRLYDIGSYWLMVKGGGGFDFRKEILMISYSKDLPFQVLFLKKKKSFSTIHPPTILFEFYLMYSTTTSFPIVPSWIILWSSIKKSLHVINISYSIFLNLVDLSYHRRSPWKKKMKRRKTYKYLNVSILDA